MGQAAGTTSDGGHLVKKGDVAMAIAACIELGHVSRVSDHGIDYVEWCQGAEDDVFSQFTQALSQE